jgi:hypothetical protein
VLDLTRLIERVGRRWDIAITSSANALGNDTTNDDPKDQTKRNGKPDQHHEA